jgi:hypothetical protein
LSVLKSHSVKALYEESTYGDLKDQTDFMPSFLPYGNPEDSRSGVAKGLQ